MCLAVTCHLTLKTSQGEASLLMKVKTVQPIQSRPLFWQWKWKQSPMPSTRLHEEVTLRPHIPSSSEIQWTCYKKVEWEALTGMCQWSTSTFQNCCGWTALEMPEWMKMTKQIDWWAKQPSQVTCVSEVKCWGAWGTTCRHKAKTSQSWSPREGRCGQSSLKGQERAIINQTNTATVLKAMLGKLLRDGWSAYGLLCVC